MFFVSVDFELFAVSCGQVRDHLLGKVHFNLGLGIVLNCQKQFRQEAIAYLDGKHEVVQFVVLVDVCEKRADDDAEAIAGNGPCSMFATAARSEVLAGHENAAGILRIVEDKILNDRAIFMITPIAEQVFAKEAFLPGSRFQKTGRDYLIGVHILQRQGHASTFYNIKFLFQNSSRGSVITPVTAQAAATNGDARMVREPGP